MTCDEVVSNGPTRITLIFIDLEKVYDRVPKEI